MGWVLYPSLVSLASCTVPLQSCAHPVWRVAITSEWSLKIERACFATYTREGGRRGGETAACGVSGWCGEEEGGK